LIPLPLIARAGLGSIAIIDVRAVTGECFVRAN
jgi:hypothetical protein